MPLRKFPQIDTSKTYAIAGQTLQDMFDAIQQDGNLRVAPPLFVKDGPGGKVIALALPPGASLLRLTSTATGAGTYNARVQQVQSSGTTQSSATDLNVATWWQDLNTSDDAVYQNIAENKNPAGTHWLPTGTNSFVIGWLASRFASDTTPANRPLYQSQAPAENAPFMVALTQTGGATGTQTTAATWTYTAKSLDGSTTWGTVLSPQKPRENGTYTAATLGIGYIDNTFAFKLAEAYEKPGTAGCS